MIEIAQRTSPTNIGLWLLTILAANDLKYITIDEVLERIQNTFGSLKQLELYEGHFLNWYDILTLKPLYPRYVSTVDSGNFLASLWTLEQGLHELLMSPILPLSTLEGIQDPVSLLDKRDFDFISKLIPLQNLLSKVPQNNSEMITIISASLKLIQDFISKENIGSENGYAIKKIEQHLLKNQELIERYYSWMKILQNLSHDDLLEIDPEAIKWRDQLLNKTFSLQELNQGDLSIECSELLRAFEKKQPLSTYLNGIYHQLKNALESAQWLAGEKIGLLTSLLSELRVMSNRINMKFLYNTERKLFSIGYRVDDCRLDSSYYDLLASEARIASLVSIAKGDVPVEHWWSLGRPYRKIDGHQVLLSWGGTMFEYLMPLLFNYYYPDSLLGRACKEAVEFQIRYGKIRGIPWGISEAAFSEIDIRKTYQYRSFGVPGLGFKRGLEEDLVISPYSTALALAVNPKQAILNFRELENESPNILSDCGFYESIDYTRQKGPLGERESIVYAFMAHHEGMSLLAFDNVLNNRIIPERFHSNPQIMGVESLLYERVPVNPAVAKGSRGAIPIARLTAFSTVPIMGIVTTPHTDAPKVNLLSNGEYSIMLTNSGGSFSRWKDLDITRWRSDITCDQWGTFCYIKNVKTNAVWSIGYHPTETKGKKYSVSFKVDKVEISRRDDEIDTSTEIAVSPEDNAEIRLITLANLSKNTQELELTSYTELALSPHEADRSHPSFNKLFIETEALPDLSAVLAFRRLRSYTDQPIWAAHIVTTHESSDKSIQYETDRSLFIGRGRTLKNPQALQKDLTNSFGAVLDPIFSIRKTVKLLPLQRLEIAFITAVADSREKIMALVNKYRDIASSHRSFEMAWTQAQLELRHLRIHQEEVQLFQKLASRVLYPHAQLRPSADRLKRSVLGQSHLWTYGISGDLPIVVTTVADIHEIDLVKQVIVAHAFWRMRGLKTDLVILNEEVAGYDKPLFEQLQKIIQSHAHHTDIAKPGGVFLINCDQIPDEDLLLILSVARANLVAARGSLRQQLVSPVESIKFTPRLVLNKKAHDFPSKPLQFIELDYFNGLGGFTKDGREYVMHLGPNEITPAPWINVIANPNFGTLVSESGLGCAWYKNSQTNRITPWTNDPVLNTIKDSIYLRDDDLGTYWNTAPGPVRELDPYQIRHGQGYTRFAHNSHGIEQDLLIFVPNNPEGGTPIRIQRMRLRNSSNDHRNISLFAYSELVMGGDKEETQMHVITEWDPESQALFAYNHYHPDFGNHIAFACSSPLATSFSGNRTEFLGRNNEPLNPAKMKKKILSGMTGAAIDPCFTLHIATELTPHEEKEFIFILGYAPDRETARKYILECRESKWVEQALQETISYWDQLLGTIQVETPIPCIDYSMNRWLLYQNLSCRFWGRMAFYQSSGAYGFRDQLQDVMALVYTAPKIAREHILKTASRQFLEGDVQHWWHEQSGAGVRTRISDDLLWLPFVTAQYIRVTDDLSILDEQIPFLKGELLKEGQHEAYFIPEISQETGSLLEHCRRAIHKGVTEGPHGLPLIGGGDWNDGMNLVGIEGKGESVWLAWFLVHVMNDFAEILSKIGQQGSAEGFQTQAKRLAEKVESNAWDGKWYRRAYFDDGTPLGSQENMEDSIDSIAQSWAVLCGAADPIRVESAMKSVEEFLIKSAEGLILLLTPAFDKSPLEPGYIKGYPPGVRENGGQYTHGSLWVPMAFARKGEADKAVTLLNMIHPVAHSLNLEESMLYKIEPYVFAGDVYSLPGKVGRGGWSWYTGAAGWMYRIWLEEILGFTLRGGVLSLKPRLPKDWTQISIKYKYLNTSYEITIENQNRGNIKIELDGIALDKNEIHLANDSKLHKVRCMI